LIRLILGSRSKPSSFVIPNPISDWPWVSTYEDSTAISVPWWIAPSTIAWTSLAEQLSSWECTTTDPLRSTLQ
jgi:hypothetical protein